MFAVVTTFNFDPDSEVVLFPDYEKAKSYIKNMFEFCMRDEKAEQATRDEDDQNLWEDMCVCERNGEWAEMVWRNEYTDEDESRYDYCMWTIVKVSEPRKFEEE